MTAQDSLQEVLYTLDFGLLFLGNVLGFTLLPPWAIGILATNGGVTAIIAAFQEK